MAPRVSSSYACVIGTMDTKQAEIIFLAESLISCLSRLSAEVKVRIVDVSAKKLEKSVPSHIEVVSVEEVLRHHPAPSRQSLSFLPDDRGSAVSIVSSALHQYLQAMHVRGELAGALGVGGSGGTSLIAPALRSLPIGFPKILVSTVASGNTAPYIETSDLILLPSVVDVAGLNRVSKVIFSNAASALAGMIASQGFGEPYPKDEQNERPTIGLTMFGVTTPCVDAVRKHLEDKGFETLIFHATGIGGKAMENLVSQGLIQGVLDITTTEVADHIVGGVLACSEKRFEAIIRQKIPLVLSVGALDMVNFGSMDTVPSEFSDRQLFVHNSQVTLMRTTVEENKAAARFIAQKINLSSVPVQVLIPEKGISALDASGKPFCDENADAALFEELESCINQTSERQVRRIPHHINDKEFADALLEAFLEIFPSHSLPSKSTSEMTVTHIQHRSLGNSHYGIPPISSAANPETVKMRQSILARIWKQIDCGIPIIGAGAGTGISAKFEEAGGADLIVIYNSGRFRMGGRGSLSGLLPFKDANAVVLEMADEVIPVVKRTPVLAGVCASDPFRQMDRFLKQLEALGFAGVQNFPTVGLIDGKFRQNLEETGMGFGLEVDMIRKAHTMGFLTTPYAFNEAESAAMAQAGADIIVAHMGLTTSGSIGAQTALTLEESVVLIQKIADVAHAINPDAIVLCHGGPISGPKEAAFVLQRTKGVHGFYGASSMERLPVEEAIKNTVSEYKAISFSGDS
ncbi:hypothetical protein KP509_23G069100 [Ceratopteris richardii]|uniref:Uncharacterized protein n=1 Tax=Ceratopteris richardii TaxID=49495 RepID=A0A8T2S1I7_CERRI|nr:hypothetical protein KP509_23G069100 [Ceratopteris richardii]